MKILQTFYGSKNLKPELAGGVKWDAGAYPISIIRSITGEKPIEIMAH